MDLTKAYAILHPVRMRIIQRLAAGMAGRQMTAQEIGNELPDVSHASLYRHLARLVEAGVVEVVDEHPVRGTVERVYALGQTSARLGPEDIASLTPEEHMRYFATFVAGLLGDYARYLERSKINMATDGVGYQQLPFYLTDEELASLSRDINAAILPYVQNEPAPGRKLRVLTTIMIPADDQAESNATSGKD